MTKAGHNSDPCVVQNDRHGFTVYSVFAIAGQAQVSAVSELRRAMYSRTNNPPAYVNAPAHVTLKRLFSGIPNIEDIQEVIHGVAESTKPFWIDLAAEPQTSGFDAEVPVGITNELSALNYSLEAAITPLAQREYGSDHFRPHMTLFTEASVDESLRGMRLLKGLRLGTGFYVESIEMMARNGPLTGGRWQSIASFDLDIWS